MQRKRQQMLRTRYTLVFGITNAIVMSAQMLAEAGVFVPESFDTLGALIG